MSILVYLRGIDAYFSERIMSSRSRRILDMCLKPKNEEAAASNDSEELFEIMELPIDIVNDSFLNNLDPESWDSGLLPVPINIQPVTDHYLSQVDNTFLNKNNDNNLVELRAPEVTQNVGILDNRNHHNIVCETNHSDVVESDNDSRDLDHVQPITNYTTEDEEDESHTNNLNDHEANRTTVKKKCVLGENRKLINKKLRMQGKQYLGYRRPNNQTKTFQDVIRGSRKLGVTCISPFCKKSRLRKCNEISEIVRQEIFNNFWKNLSWEQRATYICNLVVKTLPKNRRDPDVTDPRRMGTLKYSLKVGNNNIPVCKKMFLSTLGLREWQVHNWVTHSKHGISNENTNGKKGTRELIPRSGNVFMRQFLENLNKLPSHYCRKDSQKLYLEQSFANITELYGAYAKYCKESNNENIIMCQNSLTKMVKQLNIALYKPKKDECDICCQYKEKNLTEEEWAKHQTDKERARKEKANDKEESMDGSKHVVSMDLQAVKVCPSIFATALFFKTKLCVHNFTLYNLASKQCTCYWFDETQSDLQASTFASFIVDYIRRHLNDGKPIIIFSDGCTYQNRNNIVSNALLNLSMELNVVIEQKYLIKGHTQMECDSVHASIENKLKNKKIYLPSDYARICEEARSKPEKYETIVAEYDFFTNFNNLQIYPSIRPGRKPGDPTVVDIRALKYSPDGNIFYKLDFDSEYQPLPQRARASNSIININLPKLHTERLKIKKSKFEHLQQLKKVLPKDCWHYYDALPHA